MTESQRHACWRWNAPLPAVVEVDADSSGSAADTDGQTSGAESDAGQAASGEGRAGGDENDGDKSDGGGSDGEVSGAEASGGDAETSGGEGGEGAQAETGGETPGPQATAVLTRSEHEARHRTLEEQKNCSRCAYYAWAKRDGFRQPCGFVNAKGAASCLIMESPCVAAKSGPWALVCGACVVKRGREGCKRNPNDRWCGERVPIRCVEDQEALSDKGPSSSCRTAKGDCRPAASGPERRRRQLGVGGRTRARIPQLH